MKKYWAIVRIGLLNSFVYRADFFLWGASELLDTIVFIFLWVVIFGDRQAIGGFTLSETVTYLIGTGMITNFIYTWVGQDLEKDIQRGSLTIYLTKPISYPLARFFNTLAEKPLNILIRAAVYLIVAFFFRDKFMVNREIGTWILLLLSTVLALFINYLIDFTFGCLAFWTTTSRGTFGVLRTVVAIFSGGYAPLTFFPLWFQKLSSFLPFIYTRYFPMLIYLKKMTWVDIGKGFLVQMLWILLLFLCARFVWTRGIRRFEGVGI